MCHCQNWGRAQRWRPGTTAAVPLCFEHQNVLLRKGRASVSIFAPFRIVSYTLVSIVWIRGGHSRILVVTSLRPMEGKTTAVSNLGIVFAEIGSKALLIDGDMHHPRLHRMFDRAKGRGLSDILCDRNAMEEIPLDVLVKKTAIPHLYLLPIRAASDNFFGLLYSSRMSRLFRRAREVFDYVLMDAPSLEFADTGRMARYSDGLMLVVRANYTLRETAQAATQRLEGDRTRVTGTIILNRWDQFRSDVSGYYLFRGKPEYSTPDWKAGL